MEYVIKAGFNRQFLKLSVGQSPSDDPWWRRRWMESVAWVKWNVSHSRKGHMIWLISIQYIWLTIYGDMTNIDQWKSFFCFYSSIRFIFIRKKVYLVLIHNMPGNDSYKWLIMSLMSLIRNESSKINHQNESWKRCTYAISSPVFYFGRAMYIDRSDMHFVVCYHAK